MCMPCVAEEELGPHVLHQLSDTTAYPVGHWACADQACQCVVWWCLRARITIAGRFQCEAIKTWTRHYNWIRVVAALAMRRATHDHPFRNVALQPDVVGVIEDMAFGDSAKITRSTRIVVQPTNLAAFCDTLFARSHCDSKKRTLG
jgi:hypothetical protein